MVRTFRKGVIVVKPVFYIAVAFTFLVVPVRWIIGWFLAVFVHEFSHYLALHLQKVPVLCVTVGAAGAKIQTGMMTAPQEIICALAGPLGGLILLSLLQIFPYASLCALGQSLFNLLPIYPMDGGRALTGMCVMLAGERSGVLISKVISYFFLLLLLCATLLITLHYRLGFQPLIIMALLVVRAVKIPCKDEQQIVQ